MGAPLAVGKASSCVSLHLGFLFAYWCVCVWNASPVCVLSAPSHFGDLGRLPSFYAALLSAWKSAGGCFRGSRGVLSVGSGLTVSLVSSLTTKSAYSLLLIDRSVLLIVWRSSRPLLACYIGPPLGVSFSYLTWIVLSLTSNF